jgi:hypothetical protein
MGNVLWQVSACVAYAQKHGLDFSVQNTSTHSFWNPLYLQHLVNPNWDESKERVLIKEPHFHYAEIPFDESWRDKNIILDGYWQSYKYIEGYSDKILELFNFNWHLIPDVCSLHCRFGDFLTIEGKHILPTNEYISTAISIIQKKTGIQKFKVFSDDLRYFKEKHGHLYNFEYSTNTNEVDDLVEISCHHSQINSSSTYAWWGAWLNRNPEKIIVTPELWFQPNWDGANTNDIIPESWIKVS